MRTGLDRLTRALRRKQNVALLLLLVVSVLLRVAVAFYLGDDVPPPVNAPDDTSYSYLAERLAAGHGYSFDRPWYPFGKPAGYPTAHWSFLFTAYLAGIYALFGAHPLIARLAGAVLGGILLPVMVCRLSRRLFPDQDRVAWISMGCAVFYAFFILYAARLVTETLYIIALLWTLERGMALAKHPTVGKAVILGLALGITTLLRQSVLPWVILFGAWLLWVGRLTAKFWYTLRVLVVALFVLALVIVPFTIRNYAVYGRFLLLNSNAGYAMYSAQNPMHGTSFQEFAAAPIPEELLNLDEVQLDRELMRRGIGFVLADPGRYLLLSLSRIRDYFEFWPTSDTTLLYNLGRVVSFGLFLPFMLYGLYLALRLSGPFRSRADWARFSISPLALILLFGLFYSLLHILTWAMPRYRLPVDAAALPFAALAIERLWIRLCRLFPRACRDVTATQRSVKY